MPLLHTLDETLRDGRVFFGCRGRIIISHHHVIHHPKSRHKFRPGALRQQRLGRIGYFHHQELAGREVLAESRDVFSEQRIEMAGDPLARLVLEPLAGLLVGDDFRTRVQIFSAGQEFSRGRSLVYQHGDFTTRPGADLT